MAEQEAKTLSQEERMRLFLALVEAQDGPMTVAQSRKAVAELASRRRTAVLLHPRYSDEPPADGSKVGGTLLWPASEPWPTCDTHPGLRLVPVLQLRADEFPEVVFPPGKDLLQVLWCPR